MKTIDVIVAVNSDKLSSAISDGAIAPGTMGAPTNLGAWQQSDILISMIAQSSFVTGNQGQSELSVNANPGDYIQWAITTFDNDVDYTVFLYNGDFNPAQIIGDLNYDLVTSNTYLPGENNPTGPLTKVNNKTYIVSGKVLSGGVTVQYTLSFALVDNSTGTVLGYFYWDPFIKVA